KGLIWMSSPSSHGFTVIELLVAVTLVALVGGMAIPYASELYEIFDKRNAEMSLLQDLRLAQAQAVEQGCQGIFAVDADSKGYSYGCDYVPFSDASPPVPDEQMFLRDLPNKVKLSASDIVIFNSRGQVVDEQGFLTTRTLTLAVTSNDGDITFNTGTLTGTGFFSYSQ
ncbi:MAG: GspH/FimT family pseudopilin, partial [Bdellovibrionales bacterium]|nr:GspH/FimT family pseudopilin [Bdellovibrionales bacterium]